jgi:hypothetical protein
MNDNQRLKYQRIFLIIFGILFIFGLYPLSIQASGCILSVMCRRC